MTAVEATTTRLDETQLGRLFQYTVEAYKTFQKLAESLPNPMTATTFKQFAADERTNRDLLEMKYAASGVAKLRVTLGADLQFQDIHEGDLSYREAAEFLIAREKTMMRRLDELGRGASEIDRNLLTFLAT